MMITALNIISSCPPFSTADSLRSLLKYLVTQTVENPGEPIREAHIAEAVFNKTEGFNPRPDSTVRVQTSRLRSKLSEYYLGEGQRDEWVLELPKGSYRVTLRQREIETDLAIEVVKEKMVVSPWLYALGGSVLGVLLTVLVMRSIA